MTSPSAKDSYYEWLSEMERKLTAIRTHVDRLPASLAEEDWNDQDYHEVAQMWAKIGNIASTSNYLYQGIGEILAEKMRLDAGRN